jgi:hypothetical protein
MGHHYTPQEYLRGFQCPDRSGMIWMYDRLERRFTCVPIKTVAQEVGYYSDEDERLLNRLVEGPANPILKKIRQGGEIDDTDRSKLVDYIGTLITRGPMRRRWCLDRAPSVTDEVVRQQERELVELTATSSNRELADRNLSKFKQMKPGFLARPQAGLEEFLRQPWPSSQMLQSIEAMTWRIVRSTTSERFLTSDTPVWFNLGRATCESRRPLICPLATDIALIAIRQRPPKSTSFEVVGPLVVREVNRRIANGAVRFIFFHANAEWLPRLAQKARPRFSRIKWTYQ